MKMANIDAVFDFQFTDPKDSNGVIIDLHLCLVSLIFVT